MGRRTKSLLIGLVGTVSVCYRTFFSPHSQALGWFPYRGDNGRKVIALTFDDGPNEPFTTDIADFLADRSIRATFFQVGRCVERFPEATKRLVGQGHVIGNHSYSHEMTKCIVPGHQRRQTDATQEILGRTIGRLPALYRPPWLLRTPTLDKALRRHGLQAVSGEFCHPLEVLQPRPERIARRALSQAGPGVILIFHDGFNADQRDRTNTVEAVKIVVMQLVRLGYSFVTVNELLDIPAYRDVVSADRTDQAARPPIVSTVSRAGASVGY